MLNFKTFSRRAILPVLAAFLLTSSPMFSTRSAHAYQRAERSRHDTATAFAGYTFVGLVGFTALTTVFGLIDYVPFIGPVIAGFLFLPAVVYGAISLEADSKNILAFNELDAAALKDPAFSDLDEKTLEVYNSQVDQLNSVFQSMIQDMRDSLSKEDFSAMNAKQKVAKQKELISAVEQNYTAALQPATWKVADRVIRNSAVQK